MKIGDKIKCVVDSSSRSLVLNATYTIVDINEYGNFKIKDFWGESPPNHYCEARFEVIEEVKIDFSKEYRIRDGRKVNLIGKSSSKLYCIVGEIIGTGGTVRTWTEDGRCFYNKASKLDLIEYVEKRVVVRLGKGVSMTLAQDSFTINTDGENLEFDKKDIKILMEKMKEVYGDN